MDFFQLSKSKYWPGWGHQTIFTKDKKLFFPSKLFHYEFPKNLSRHNVTNSRIFCWIKSMQIINFLHQRVVGFRKNMHKLWTFNAEKCRSLQVELSHRSSNKGGWNEDFFCWFSWTWERVMSHFSQTVSTHTYGRVKSSYIEDTIHSRSTVARNVWIMSGQLPKVTFVRAIKV